MPPRLAAALARGATVVTSNNRLARRLATLHDAAQQAVGLGTWIAARILPWNAFVAGLWRDAVATGHPAAAPRLLSPAQASVLWRRVIAADFAAGAPLADVAGATELAVEAWERMHAYGAGGESWRGWDRAAVGEDSAAFARWADGFAKALRDEAAIDAARALDELIRTAPPWAAFVPPEVVLAGFVELTPQQLRACAALREAGIGVDAIDPVAPAAGTVAVVGCPTARDEVAAALRWARSRSDAAPGSTVGVVIVDLAARRDEVAALADDILCPALQWPGRHAAPRPYDLSLGAALDDVPCVAAALDLLALADAPLSLERAARLARSPFLPGDAAAWLRRAGVEHDWQQDGREAIDAGAFAGSLETVDAAFAQRCRTALARSRLRGRAAPRAWCDDWRALLAAVGWPGDAARSSAVHQALGAWDDLLATLSGLDVVTGRLARREALALLAGLAAETVFQPEAPAAPIRILGLLEATGLPFDALWVAGLGAEAWPPPARANPLLPLDWQRERGVPRSSAAREQDYARLVTDLLARAAPEVVFSHPESVDDHPSVASALIAAWPRTATPAAPPCTAPAMFAARPDLDACDDTRAPPVPAGTALRGGAALFEAQSDCPFRAVAAFRLRAEPWPRREEGLSAAERGQLAHLALASFWRRVRDRRTLDALDPAALRAAIDDAVAEALRGPAVDERRWRSLPPPVAPGEGERLVQLLAAWIERAERGRPDFTVAEIETSGVLALGGFSVRVRQDRVDRLADGSIAIIDYKTGRTVAPQRWFDPRPQAPQLGVYLLARRAADPAVAVGAIAYARLALDALDWQGLARDAALLPPLPSPEDATRGAFADWPAVETHWQRAIGDLATEIATGVAVVAPRDKASTCRRCGLQSLCRIDGAVDEAADEASDGE